MMPEDVMLGCAIMRTTVTLDDDVATALKRLARERGVPFKAILNSTLRRGLASPGQAAEPYRTPTRDLGLRPGVDLDRALGLAAALEDEAIVDKLELRK